MGSVSGKMKCPKCNSEVYMYGTIFSNGEVYDFCSECGYKYVTQYEGAIGKVITESTDDASSEDLISEFSEYPENFYRYYIIENSIGGSISGPIENQQQLEEYLEYIEEIRPKTHITKVMIGRFVGGKFITENI